MKKAICILLVFSMLLCSGCSPEAKMEKAQTLIDQAIEDRSISALRNTLESKSIYQYEGDATFSAYILSHVQSLVDSGEIEFVMRMLDVFEDCNYTDTAVLDGVQEIVSNSLGVVDRLVYLSSQEDSLGFNDPSFYIIDFSISDEELVAFIAENGVEEIDFESGYYSDPENRWEKDRKYGEYGTYTDYEYMYFGDFCIEYQSGYKTKSSTNIEAEYFSRQVMLFRGFSLKDLEEVPDFSTTIYSAPFLFIETYSDLLVYDTSGDYFYGCVKIPL